MSILAMTVSTAKKPDMRKDFFYNGKESVWKKNLSLDNYNFRTPDDMIKYLKKKYKKLYFFRINMARTFGGKFVKPQEVYSKDMDDPKALPNCIMVSDGNQLMLVTTKAKRAKEFIEFGSNAKNIYVPVLLYRTITGSVQFINFK